MKRREPPRPGKKGEVTYPDPAFAKDYPSLALGMCDAIWDDGKPREVWTFNVRFKEKGVLVTVTDKNYSECLYTEGEDLLSALALVEECLSQGTASWRKFTRK
jgi:hypothetical protein